MKAKNKIIIFYKNNLFLIRLIFSIIGALIFFYAFFFYDKEFSLETIKKHKNDTKMHICIIISLLGGIWISFYTGKIKKSP